MTQSHAALIDALTRRLAQVPGRCEDDIRPIVALLLRAPGSAAIPFPDPHDPQAARLFAERAAESFSEMATLAEHMIAVQRDMWRVLASRVSPSLPLLRRHAATAQARATHQREGFPYWMSGQWPTSGCATCSVAEHEHGRVFINVRTHVFVPPTMAQIKRRMQLRRIARADWYRDHGFGLCRYCRRTEHDHARPCEVYPPWMTPFDTIDADPELQPFTPYCDTEILILLTQARAARWDFLYPEGWVDEGLADAHAAALADLDPYEHLEF